MRIPSCVWTITPELVAAIDGRLGVPVDSYVNGAQTWLLDNGPHDITLEWRLHPTAGYSLPAGASHYDVWERVVHELQTGSSPSAIPIGDGSRPLTALWDGLECFPAYDDELEPAALAHAATDALGVAPDASGLVDHDAVGDAWERSQGRTSIVAALLEQLAP